jgi:ribose transport system ATP-binding protein
MIMPEPKKIIEIKGITKNFPGVTALNHVDLDIHEGEIHILVGENGAGKSSLIKILCGIYQPDAGELLYQGEKFKPANTFDAMQAGIRVVYQELNLLPYLSVAENIFFEHMPSHFGVVDFKTLYQNTQKMLDEVGLNISPRTPVEHLGIAQKQLIEIAKALTEESKVLILDEPTATLTSKEIARLFEIIRKLKARGVTIIYISHRLQETIDIGDRITVLRNGSKVSTCLISEVTVPEIVKMMVGREMASEYPFYQQATVGQEILKVEELAYKGNPNTLSFSVKEGEMLGIAGLVGSGRTETMRAIFGADPKTSGKITLDGKVLNIRQPKDAVREGICLLTEDRKGQGLILDMACDVNISLANLPAVSRSGLMQFRKEEEVAARLIGELAVKTSSPKKWARFLSGGNQQKIVLAKWLFRNARVLIFDEPTRGIDVGAKFEIYQLLWKLAGQGKVIIVVSSDLPELMGICHRILVFSNGKIAGEVARDEFNQEKILSLAYQEYLNTGIGKAN